MRRNPLLNGKHRHGRRHGCCCQRDNGQFTLLDCHCGQTVYIKGIDPSVSCAPRLRELGLLDGARVVVLKLSDPLLILVDDTRIAMDWHTAAGIEVEAGSES
ncbi:ferrous iron transport protein A [bacterium]|nr:ferrous iron transport protein A [bacterium]